MKHFFAVIFLLFISNIVLAQYYYNDVLATQQSNAQQQLLATNKIKKVVAMSKENDNSASDGFMVEQTIAKDANEIVTITKTSATVSSTLFSYYSNGKITKTKTVSKDIFTVTDYLYNDNGSIQSILSSTTDTFMNSFTSESHIWLYNEQQQPTKMYRIKNNTDTTFVEFVLDENKMVAVENWKRNGRYTEAYYYYYNDKKQLTDIVRYNKNADKMLPDFMYEYDANGRVKQMVQVLAAGKNYNTWRYSYLENGLKLKETCYDKQKQLIGTIEYTYTN
jgi:hypothetical protein